ncbi:hypothetical protein TUZN_1864 [Thermoproteus uzoniensis 768-20]|uniref:Uncharacterized protein n=1 Tax=Thermoproteus uzoniensis (strain 768-20) TaxID=999630 RepID=F2L412_THEU7|nr:hypothetical protein TUZN_1864 [Thermoproteus uzoniensis 768-20]
MGVRRLLLISLLLLILFIIFHNIFLIILILFIILFFNRIRIYIKLYRIYSGIEREAVAAALLSLIAIILIRAVSAAKVFALLLGIASVMLAPFYPQIALSLSLFGLAVELPIAGAPRLLALAAAIALGYLAGLKASRGGLVRIYTTATSPAEALKALAGHKVIVKGPDSFYALARGGAAADGELVFFSPSEALLYRCRALRCLPLSVKTGDSARREFEKLLDEYLYLLFPELGSVETPLVVVTNDEIAERIANRLGKTYILSPRGAPSTTANLFDAPADKAARAVAAVMGLYGLASREVFEEVYTYIKSGGARRIDPQIPGAPVLRDLVGGLSSWPDLRYPVVLGDDPKSVLISYLLYLKYGGFIITYSRKIFNILKELEVNNIILITKTIDIIKGESYIVVGPISGRFSNFLDKYIDKINKYEYVGYVAGSPVHGYL